MGRRMDRAYRRAVNKEGREREKGITRVNNETKDQKTKGERKKKQGLPQCVRDSNDPYNSVLHNDEGR